MSFRVFAHIVIAVCFTAGCDDAPAKKPQVLVTPASHRGVDLNAPSSTTPDPPGPFSACKDACKVLHKLDCAEEFLCRQDSCESHVAIWNNEAPPDAAQFPRDWCERKMNGFWHMDGVCDCIARSSTPEDVEDCGVACSWDCIIPPCASKAAPRQH